MACWSVERREEVVVDIACDADIDKLHERGYEDLGRFPGPCGMAFMTWYWE
jgi:hypothetical protein